MKLPLATQQLGLQEITPKDVVRVSTEDITVRISPEAYRAIDAARSLIDELVARDIPTYGVTRGLGSLRDQRISGEMQEIFQSFVFASHHAGTGSLLNREEARAVMFTRLAVMARGNSGGSRELIDGLAALLNSGVTPAIPEAGSVGSADLALLAAIGSVMVGNGRAIEAGTIISGSEALQKAGLLPVELQAKDGHALVVANSGSVGIGCLAAFQLANVARMADLSAASSIEALTFNIGVFDAEVLSARPHPGQITSGERMRELFSGGALAEGEALPTSLQDPLSFRTVPQVHGVLLEQLQHLNEVLTIELNSQPENPFIEVDRRRMVSNGNFSALRLALALDQARVALAHLMILSERRISVLIARLRAERPLEEQLESFDQNIVPVVPPVLANVAATLSARVQHLANPISLFSAVVGDGVEDHNAQAYSAARRLREAIEEAEQLFAIEALAASGVAALSPQVQQRRRGPNMQSFTNKATEIYRSYEPSGGTQVQLDAFRELLHEKAEKLNGVFMDLHLNDPPTNPTGAKL